MSLPANTHLTIDQGLCGQPDHIEPGRATVTLETTAAMSVDRRGLIHGGFIFGVADYAAMLAVNDPNVVLGAADVRFDAPVAVGQQVQAQAEVVETSGKKYVVEATATADETTVLHATFTTFVVDQHVLDQ